MREDERLEREALAPREELSGLGRRPRRLRDCWENGVV